MSNRKVTLELHAKNALQRGLSEAGSALQSFGKSALNIGAFFAKAFLGAGAAVAGFAAKAIHAYAGLEKEQSALVATLDSFGESGRDVLPVLQQQAKAIQDATGQTQSQTLAIMNQLKIQGVQTNQLGDATKGVMALTRAGMGQEAAARAIAAATQGNFQALTRYIPELRNATDEADKARITNEFLSRGYSAQQSELRTVAGQWNNLKNRVGDVWEEVGRAIMQNGALMSVMERAGDAVRGFAERVSQWVDSGGVQRLIVGVRLFYEDFRERFQNISSIARIVFASISDAVDTAFGYMANIIRANVAGITTAFRGIGEVGAAVFTAIRERSRESFAAIGEAVRKSASDNKNAWIELGEAVLGNNALVTRRTEEALQDRDAMHEAHAERRAEIDEWVTDKLKDEVAERVEAEKDGMNEIVAAAEETADKRVEIEKRTTEEMEKARQTDLQKEIDAAKQTANEKVRTLRTVAREREQLAKTTVEAIISERAAERAAQSARDADERRAERLRQRMTNWKQEQIGLTQKLNDLDAAGRLSRRDQEFLDAFEEIEEARRTGGIIAQQLSEAEKQLKELENQSKSLDDMKSELVSIHVLLNTLLRMG